MDDMRQDTRRSGLGSCAQLFIEDIHKNGLSEDVIARHRRGFPDVDVVIDKRDSFIQAGGFVMRYRQDEDGAGGQLGSKFIYHWTKADFPADSIIALLEKENFRTIKIIEKNGQFTKRELKSNET